MSIWVNGNQNRIFINTTIGCKARCVYCYLPEIGLSDNLQFSSVDSIINELESLQYFIKGPTGTVLSIGCYSECWADYNRSMTIELLKRLVEYGNYIQFATKKEIDTNDLLRLDNIATFKNQIGIFISTPTISNVNKLEKGTDPIERRLLPFKMTPALRKLYLVLYIKPVISGITIKDLKFYDTFLGQNDIKCVVGSLLEITGDNQEVSVGIHSFNEYYSEEETVIISKLGKKRLVFRHSVDLIDYLRSYDESKHIF